MGIILPGGFSQHKQPQEQGPVCFFKMGVIPVQNEMGGMNTIIMNFPCTEECELYDKNNKCCKVLSTFNNLLELKNKMNDLSQEVINLKKTIENNIKEY